MRTPRWTGSTTPKLARDKQGRLEGGLHNDANGHKGVKTLKPLEFVDKYLADRLVRMG